MCSQNSHPPSSLIAATEVLIEHTQAKLPHDAADCTAVFGCCLAGDKRLNMTVGSATYMRVDETTDHKANSRGRQLGWMRVRGCCAVVVRRVVIIFRMTVA